MGTKTSKAASILNYFEAPRWLVSVSKMLRHKHKDSITQRLTSQMVALKKNGV